MDTPLVEFRKVILYKNSFVSAESGEIVYESLNESTLNELGVELIAEYPIMVLGRIAVDLVDGFVARAESAGLGAQVNPLFDRIHINGYDFPSGTEPEIDPALRISNYEEKRGLYVVQFMGPLTGQWHDALLAAGSAIGVFPENSFLLVANPTSFAEGELNQIPGVQHVSVYQPGFKIRPSLLTEQGEIEVYVQLDATQPLDAVQAVVEELLNEEVDIPSAGPIRNLQVTATVSQIQFIARRPEVIAVDYYGRHTWSGERQAMVAAGLHNGSRPNTVGAPLNHGGYPEWLASKGYCDPCEQTSPTGCSIKYWTKVAVFDTGLDVNECTSSDPTCDSGSSWATGSPSRHQDMDHVSCTTTESCALDTCGDTEFKFFCIEEDGTNVCREGTSGPYVYDDPINHGSSVASIIAGDPLSGTSIDPIDNDDYYKGMGIAPAAQILVARLLDTATGDYAHYDTDDYNALLTDVGEAGARFANNSWNQNVGATKQQYSVFSQLMDRLVRDSRYSYSSADYEMTIVFSAGNRYSNDDPGVYAPATAKNVISVGASRSWLDSGGTEDHPCFEFEGIEDEYLIDDIESYSARGVLVDTNRIKPDLVAPGPDCTATSSADYSQTAYKCFWGTSSSAPVVTGAAVLVDAWYVAVNGSIPSPAMLKAIMIAHADDLVGGTDYWSATPEILSHRPSLPQGWGRVNIGNAIQDDVAVVFLDEDHASTPTRRFVSGSGTSWSDEFEVDPNHDGSGDFILVAMVFTDKYALLNASPLKVNDLNLRVVDQQSTVLRSHSSDGGEDVSSQELEKGIPTATIYNANDFVLDSGDWVSRAGGVPNPPSPSADDNNVELIRIRASDIADGVFTIEVNAPAIAGKAVPGLDGAYNNQDFALYVYGANLQ